MPSAVLYAATVFWTRPLSPTLSVCRGCFHALLLHASPPGKATTTSGARAEPRENARAEEGDISVRRNKVRPWRAQNHQNKRPLEFRRSFPGWSVPEFGAAVVEAVRFPWAIVWGSWWERSLLTSSSLPSLAPHCVSDPTAFCQASFLLPWPTLVCYQHSCQNVLRSLVDSESRLQFPAAHRASIPPSWPLVPSAVLTLTQMPGLLRWPSNSPVRPSEGNDAVYFLFPDRPSCRSTTHLLWIFAQMSLTHRDLHRSL